MRRAVAATEEWRPPVPRTAASGDPRRTEQGIRFLGYRVFPTHRLLAQENVRRFRRRLQWMRREFAVGHIGFDMIRPRIMSWVGHAQHANTYRLRTDLLRRIRSSGRRPIARLLRGGAFNNPPALVRSALRDALAPANRGTIFGVRPSRTYH